MRVEWRPVPSFEGLYDVSSEGVIRSAKRQGTDGRLLSPHPSGNGYLKVHLYRESRRKAFWVHRLVAEAFHGSPADAFLIVCHNDGDRLNNRADNLRWGTPADNYRDSVKHGTAAIGQLNGGFKNTPALQAAIYAMKRKGMSKRWICRELGISYHLVEAALREAVQ